jgi:hypothetical protein
VEQRPYDCHSSSQEIFAFQGTWMFAMVIRLHVKKYNPPLNILLRVALLLSWTNL